MSGIVGLIDLKWKGGKSLDTEVSIGLAFWSHYWPWPIYRSYFKIVSGMGGPIDMEMHLCRPFITMNVTFWWPRCGEWLFRIVIGMTSDIDVLSTHLVLSIISGNIGFVLKRFDCITNQNNEEKEKMVALITYDIITLILALGGGELIIYAMIAIKLKCTLTLYVLHFSEGT